ncbi:hypothetical protein V6N12_046926 [Hibiscus sabdariffa]|uniref:Receptor-like protein 12 n=1 Tax=Hibiscus sabdariffa TaxID=183260 RepID=A0ABR2BC24_9ROSI
MPTFWKNFNDFSDNHLEEIVPSEISNLTSLKYFDIAGNNFSEGYGKKVEDELAKGEYPMQGNLSELESLDLSSNKFQGRIPMELNNLGFLEVLNLSQNNLVGLIPRGKQFNTFTSDSYIGNLGLCGSPLSKSCNDDEETPIKFERDDGDVLNWKFSILMGYGSGLVLGLSMGYIVFTTRKPWWFIKIFERVQHRFAKWYRSKLFR